MARYIRKEAAKQLGISPSTLYRWEKEGKVPAPKRVFHNRQCVYTDELIAEIRTFMAREEDPPSRAPGRIQARAQTSSAA